MRDNKFWAVNCKGQNHVFGHSLKGHFTCQWKLPLAVEYLGVPSLKHMLIPRQRTHWHISLASVYLHCFTRLETRGHCQQYTLTVDVFYAGIIKTFLFTERGGREPYPESISSPSSRRCYCPVIEIDIVFNLCARIQLLC